MSEARVPIWEFRDPWEYISSRPPIMTLRSLCNRRLMSFTFAPRLTSSLLRPNVLYNVLSTLSLNARSNSSYRSFVTTSSVKKEDTFQPPTLRKDNSWDIFHEYTNRYVVPKMTPDELWRERSKKHEAFGHPSIYAGGPVFSVTACDIFLI